ncbi:hypothetical protein DM01DRAFT_328261, partial [Hesseltinella vesiculosa]
MTDPSLSSLHELIDQSRKQFNLPPYISPVEYDAWKQHKQDQLKKQKELLDQAQKQDQEYTGQARFLERLASFSALFINSKTPIDAEQAAKHGWADTHERHQFGVSQVFRLTCIHCQASLDVPNLTSFQAFAASKRMYALYPSFLTRNHQPSCFWHTHACRDSVTALPLTTTSDAFEFLAVSAITYRQWPTALPMVKHSLTESKLRMVDRIIKLIEHVDIFTFPQTQITPSHQAAYLLAMYGWTPLQEGQSTLLKCASCFRHALVANYFRMDDPVDANGQWSADIARRPDCIKGCFDLITEHRSHCPWVNPDKAYAHVKDAYFARPKQPLAGHAWMMEIVGKEWFRLTSDDAKNPRQDLYRADASRYITNGIAKHQWMTEDLSNYVDIRNRKRARLAEGDIAITERDPTPVPTANKRGKLDAEDPGKTLAPPDGTENDTTPCASLAISVTSQPATVLSPDEQQRATHLADSKANTATATDEPPLETTSGAQPSTIIENVSIFSSKSQNVIVEQPTAEEPTVEEPIAEEPTVEEPMAEEPIVDEPMVEEPAVAEPIVEEPAVEVPLNEEPMAEEPAVEGPAVEEPITEVPTAEEPAVDIPIVEEPVVEEPVVEEPVVEEPIVEEPI